jgi:hypothetical protein
MPKTSDRKPSRQQFWLTVLLTLLRWTSRYVFQPIHNTIQLWYWNEDGSRRHRRRYSPVIQIEVKPGTETLEIKSAGASTPDAG